MADRAGDFTPLGGMDRANHALARSWRRSGRDVHLVAHRVWPDLERAAGRERASGAAAVRLASARRAAARARRGAACARALADRRAVVANGGNADWRDVNWVHYLHAAHAPSRRRAPAAAAAAGRRTATTWRAERAALDAARRSSSATARGRRPTSRAARRRRRRGCGSSTTASTRGSSRRDRRRARRDARAALGLGEPPVAVFIGALGDRRKGFDVLFEAWRCCAADPAWDAELLVAGARRGARAWQRRAADAGLAARMRFLGFRATCRACSPPPTCWCIRRATKPTASACTRPSAAGVPAIVSARAGVAERYPPTSADSIVCRAPRPTTLVARAAAVAKRHDGLARARRRVRASAARRGPGTTWRPTSSRSSSDVTTPPFDAVSSVAGCAAATELAPVHELDLRAVGVRARRIRSWRPTPAPPGARALPRAAASRSRRRCRRCRATSIACTTSDGRDEWIAGEFEAPYKDSSSRDILDALARAAGSGAAAAARRRRARRPVPLAGARAGWAGEGLELNPQTAAFAARPAGGVVHQGNVHTFTPATRASTRSR